MPNGGRSGKGPSTLHTLFSVGALGSLSDCELLEIFRNQKAPGAEQAFRHLVERHGPMVSAVCRSLLRDTNDADDVFQATFLVLARRADSIRYRETVGPWLHGVASRIARRARAIASRRQAREREAAEAIREGREDVSDGEALARTLHEEIDRLPSDFRDVIILCCMENQSYDAAARSLGISEPTLRGRLHRARKTLKSRLERQGIAMSVLPGVAHFGVGDRDSVSVRLVDLSVRQAISFVGGGLSNVVTSLAQGGISSMAMNTYKAVAVSLLSVGLMVGTVVVAQPAREAPPEGKLASQEGAPGKRAKDPEAQTRAIKEKLAKPSQLSFPFRMPLQDLLKTIKQQSTEPGDSGIPIYINPEGLQEANQNMESEVSLERKGKSLADDLSQALRRCQLGYSVNDGLLVIDSRTGALEARLLILESKLDGLLSTQNRLPRSR